MGPPAASSRCPRPPSTSLAATGRDKARVALVEAYAKAQGLWIDETSEEPVFTDTLELDLGTVVPSLAGPKRPQDRVELTTAAPEFEKALVDVFARPTDARASRLQVKSTMSATAMWSSRPSPAAPIPRTPAS
jgi:aconitase (EC 4.2.1.3)